MEKKTIAFLEVTYQRRRLHNVKEIGRLLKIRSEISYVVSEAFWREPQLKLLQKESFIFLYEVNVRLIFLILKFIMKRVKT